MPPASVFKRFFGRWRLPVLGLALSFLHLSAHADLWTYVDEKGITHFAATQVDERYALFYKGGDIAKLDLVGSAAASPATAQPRVGLRASGKTGEPKFEVPKRFAKLDSSTGYKSVQKHLQAAAKTHKVDYELLKAVIAEEGPQLVILGKQAIDNDMNATGQMLSALLGWGQATFASKVEIADGKAVVTREVDGGLQTIAVTLPAIVTVDLRLNEPRYASLPNIMKAKKKPLEEKTPADYGVDVTPRLTVVKTTEPATRKAGVRVGSVDELVAKLKTEAGVL